MYVWLRTICLENRTQYVWLGNLYSDKMS
jgi:hypothetical protein